MIPIRFKGNETDVVQQLYNDLINEKLKINIRVKLMK